MQLGLRSAGAPRLLVGLDIQPGFVAAAEVKVNGSLSVQRAGSIELPPNVMREGEIVDRDALADALKTLWQQNKGLSRQVRVGVANSRIVVRTLDIPPVTNRKDLDAAVRFIAAEELPMPLDSAILDFEPVGMVETDDGPRQRVVLVVARRETVQSVLSTVRAAGLRPQGVDLSAFAMIRALGGSRPGTVLYVSMGGLTNLALVVDGVCKFTRVTAGGLEPMAAELAERQALSIEDARTWLERAGLHDAPAESNGDAAVAADARAILGEGVRKLAGEVRASVEFHQGHGVGSQAAFGRRMGDTVLTGTVLRIPGFAAALQKELEMPVSPENVLIAGGADPDFDLGRLTIAAGLAVEEVTL